jgi:uncharacterized repeat protein (TIGR01451 family)/uncharacterized delta-60 repeat protein
LARYNSDGSLDATFGTAGATTAGLPAGSQANAVLIQPDGKIVAAGSMVPNPGHTNFALARFCPDGSLDDGVNCGAEGFGSGGRVITDNSSGTSTDSIRDIALQPDGKIVAAGVLRGNLNEDFGLARYCADGSLDDGVNCGPGGFGNGGIALGDLGNSDAAQALALQPDGKIVAVGGVSSSDDFGTARFCSDGQLDDGVNCGPGFGSGGAVITDFGGINDSANAVVLQEDGKIFVAGFRSQASGIAFSDLALVRYCPDGSLDDGANCGPGFGSGGTLIVDIPGDDSSEDRAMAAGIQADGKLLVGGLFRPDAITDSRFFLARLLTDGSFDASFGSLGDVDLQLESASGAEALAIQSDGMILLAGTTIPVFSELENFTLIRYQGDSADLALEKTADVSVVAPGDVITYTLTVSNASSVPVAGVKVLDHLPSGTTLVSAPGCSGTTDLSCEIGLIGADTVASPITVTVTADVEGVVVNTAEVTGAAIDTNPLDNVAMAFTVVDANNVGGNGGGCGLSFVQDAPGFLRPGGGLALLVAGLIWIWRLRRTTRSQGC